MTSAGLRRERKGRGMRRGKLVDWFVEKKRGRRGEG